jgi:hypothetical protein
MRHSLPLILVFALHGYPSMVLANQDSQGSASNQCKGMIRDATKVAKELFRQHRHPETLRDYKVSSKTKEKEIVVKFTRKSSAQFGDHPFVVYNCETKTSKYFEGE